VDQTTVRGKRQIIDALALAGSEVEFVVLSTRAAGEGAETRGMSVLSVSSTATEATNVRRATFAVRRTKVNVATWPTSRDLAQCFLFCFV
jgi:hypothetical protein